MQAVIKLIEKKIKIKDLPKLKNNFCLQHWHITCFKWGLKNVLLSLISFDQTEYVNGRIISAERRLIYDILCIND